MKLGLAVAEPVLLCCRFLSKRTENKIQIQLLGGKLELNWNQETNNISLTGQPVEVFSGEFVVCPRPDLNWHIHKWTQDFKSCASTNSATS